MGVLQKEELKLNYQQLAAFSVDQDGNFLSGYYITNKSSVGISVSVATFADSNPNGGITIKSKDKSLDGLDRSNSSWISWKAK